MAKCQMPRPIYSSAVAVAVAGVVGVVGVAGDEQQAGSAFASAPGILLVF